MLPSRPAMPSRPRRIAETQASGPPAAQFTKADEVRFGARRIDYHGLDGTRPGGVRQIPRIREFPADVRLHHSEPRIEDDKVRHRISCQNAVADELECTRWRRGA